MNPSKLQPGDQVQMSGNPEAPVLVFVGRRGWKSSRFTCERYKGQDGLDDPGYVDVPDWDMSRKYELIARAGAEKETA